MVVGAAEVLVLDVYDLGRIFETGIGTNEKAKRYDKEQNRTACRAFALGYFLRVHGRRLMTRPSALWERGRIDRLSTNGDSLGWTWLISIQ